MLPTFIIIGAMKSGTSSLHHYLGLHPDIIMSNVKEINYFITEKNYNNGIRWYETHFTGSARHYGEASTNYSKYPTFGGVPQRMYSVVPDAKLIYLVRDPIDRIISHYVHNCYAGAENRSFPEALSKLDDNHYVAVSKYYMQLEQYLKYYSKENILVLVSEELRTNRQATLKTIFNFLGVDESFYCAEFSSEFNQSARKTRKTAIGHYLHGLGLKEQIRTIVPSGYLSKLKKLTEYPPIERPKLDKDLEGKLVEYLKDDVNSLRMYAGNDLKNWRL